MSEKLPRGGQTIWTEKLGERICHRLSEGIPLAQICRDEGIGRTTVHDWQEARPEFAERIACARVKGFDAIAEECLEIADNASNDWMERESQSGRIDTVLDSDHVQRSKLRIETRLKLLAKWDPKRYGEKIETTHQAGDTFTRIVREIVKP